MKINVGGQKNKSKGNFDGWTIVDIIPTADVVLDISKDKLPFENNTISAIYTSHTLEHISGSRLPFVLSEFYRCLRDNGKIRIVVPDADKIIQAYFKGDKTFLQDRRNPAKMGFLPDHPLCYLLSWFVSYDVDKDGHPLPSHGHTMAFNYSLLKYYLNKAGFKTVEKKSFGVCSEEFKNCDFKRYKDCSVYVEAGK